jgi:hypothetical protein
VLFCIFTVGRTAEKKDAGTKLVNCASFWAHMTVLGLIVFLRAYFPQTLYNLPIWVDITLGICAYILITPPVTEEERAKVRARVEARKQEEQGASA